MLKISKNLFDTLNESVWAVVQWPMWKRGGSIDTRSVEEVVWRDGERWVIAPGKKPVRMMDLAPELEQDYLDNLERNAREHGMVKITKRRIK